MVKIRINFYIT